eukprot:2666166-Rhodomonas_salina.1
MEEAGFREVAGGGGGGEAQCWWRRREEVAQALGLVSAIDITGEKLICALEMWSGARKESPSSVEGSEELQVRGRVWEFFVLEVWLACLCWDVGMSGCRELAVCLCDSGLSLSVCLSGQALQVKVTHGEVKGGAQSWEVRTLLLTCAD